MQIKWQTLCVCVCVGKLEKQKQKIKMFAQNFIDMKRGRDLRVKEFEGIAGKYIY